MSAQPGSAAELAEYAAAQGLVVERRSRLEVLRRGLFGFIRGKPLGAFGAFLVLLWSFIAVGTIGDGGGWLGVGRYDSSTVFWKANSKFADDKIANALNGLPAGISSAELAALAGDEAIYGPAAADEQVAGEMAEYGAALAESGTLIDHLLGLDLPQIEIRDGVIYDVDHLAQTGTSNPRTTAAREGPSSEHWLGTGRGGQDLYAQIAEGARLSLYIGVLATLVGVAAGTFIGLISGVFGGNTDLAINRIMDAVQAFPPLVFLMVMRTVTEASAIEVTLVLSVLAIAPTQRIVRGAVIALREMPFVEAARSIGAGQLRVMAVHILPNIVAPLIVIFSITVGAFILAEAGLSFLGLGPADTSWGKMIADGRQFIVQSPWTSLFAGIALTSLVFGFNVLGDALRDIFDPRLRGAR